METQEPVIAGTINLDGPCPTPPGKPNPQPIPPGTNNPLGLNITPLKITQPDPICLAAEEADRQQGPEPAVTGIPVIEAPRILPGLTAEETQTLLEMLQFRQNQKRTQFSLPELPVTKEDEDRYLECLMVGKPYTEDFSRARGQLNITFRVKMARETDVINNQLRQDIVDRIISEEIDFTTRLNCYNLLVQTQVLNGVKQSLVIPPGIRQFDLRAAYDASIYPNMPDPRIYVLLGILAQFDIKIHSLNNKVLTQDF